MLQYFHVENMIFNDCVMLFSTSVCLIISLLPGINSSEYIFSLL